jgi:NAD(P)-dependent dehydrogenase (short-subunit alcohol dehydrogenase family)
MQVSERWIITGAGGGIGIALLRNLFSGPRQPNVLAFTTRPEKHFTAFNELASALENGQLHLRHLDFAQPFKAEDTDLPWPPQETSPPVFVVHNAGLLEKNTPGRWDEALARRMFEVNFWAPLRLTYAWLPYLPAGSHIVNIGSMGGFQGSAKFPGLSHYSASKAALACWTECLATELTSHGIYVNCLALGSADTDMLHRAFPGYQSPVSPETVAGFIIDFARTAPGVINGKVIPVAATTP